MEAVAISIATSALSSVVNIAATTIRDEIGLQLEVQEDMLFIKDELEMMRVFLRAASTEKLKGKIETTWIKEVQELAFDVEDCLQEASVEILMKKTCLPAMCSAKKRDRIVKKILVLRTIIENVSTRIQRYNLINKDNNGDHTYEESVPNGLIFNVESLLVGLDKPKKKLVELILENNEGKVISVVGMGGLGKTTLVRKVYGCQELRDKFKCFYWVTVLHPFNMEEFIDSMAMQILLDVQGVDNKMKPEQLRKVKLKEIMEGLVASTNIVKKKEKEIMEEIVMGYLKDNKYLIVLDDLSSLSEWDNIKHVLPKGNGSRIIVTTRLRPLAESISYSSENIYEIMELSNHDAFELFCKVVYKFPHYGPVIDDREMKDDRVIELDSEVQKQCITSTVTSDTKNDPLHKRMGNMKYGPITPEIMEEDSEMQKQYITITEDTKDDLSHERKCNMKYGSSTTEIMKEDSEVQKQCITTTITEDMKTQADLLIKRCGRIPLAIVTIGSYLATKPKTSIEWKTMHDQLSPDLAINPNLGVVTTVLTSSYVGMPDHLKPCLLYLSVFHNHKEIRRSRIIRRWMADGYVIHDSIMTAEEVGKSYFYDLMGRSMIQPSQTSTIGNGDVKRCNIHDMMYKLILEKSVDDNSISLLEDENLKTMTHKVRHLVIIGGSCKVDKVLARVKLSHMRSLSIFGEVGDYLRYLRMKLVRVLDLEGTLNLKNQDLTNVGKLCHLKYLGLRGTKISKLPNSLANLSELETLDIRNTAVVRLPVGLSKLQKLCYLRAGFDHYNNPNILLTGTGGPIVINYLNSFLKKEPHLAMVLFVPYFLLFWPLFFAGAKNIKNFGSYGVRAPRGIGELRSVNILGMIDIGWSKIIAKEMKNLTNLRKLAVTGVFKKNGKTLAKVIDGLEHLRSLVLESKDDSGLGCCLESVSYPPKYLQSLKLYSPLGKLPDWVSSLENLKKIHFRNTELTGEINAIEKLRNLKILYMSYNSLGKDVKKQCFSEGTFSRLQVMIIEGIDKLESVSIEKTALKRLEQLKISRCWCIREVSGLEFLVQLKEMEVVMFSRHEEISNRKFVRNIQEQLKKLPKEPVLKVYIHNVLQYWL